MKPRFHQLWLLVGVAVLALASPGASCFAATSLLTITVNPPGSGTVSPNLNGKDLVDGQFYDLTALPAPGYICSNWLSRVEGQSNYNVCGFEARLHIAMSPGLALQANMVTNPFPAVQGNYNGIFSTEATPWSAAAGFNYTTFTKSGKFSGYLRMGSQRLPYHGQLSLDGFATAPIRGPGSNDYFLFLSLPLGNPGDDQLSGSVYFSSTLNSQLVAYRQPVYSVGQSSPYTGKYTYFGLGDGVGCGSATNPASFAFGTASVNRQGIANWAFTLGDGSPGTFSAPISRDGFAPIFGAPYGQMGAFGGLMNFSSSYVSDWKTNLYALLGTNATASNAVFQTQLGLGGEAYWNKMPAPGHFYPGGFEQEVKFFGMPYGAATLGMPPTDYNMAFKWGNLSSNRFGTFSWSTENKLGTYAPSDWQFKLTFTLPTGRFTGSARFDEPFLNDQPLKFSGVTLQGFGASFGQFKGTNQTGEFFAVPLGLNLGF